MRMTASEFRLTAPRPKRNFAELRLQRDVGEYLKLVLPSNATWIPVPNGAHMSPRECAKLKHHNMLRPGANDLFVYFQGRSLAIELKAKAGVVRDDQGNIHTELDRAGVPTVICRNIADVRYALVSFGIPLRETRAVCHRRGAVDEDCDRIGLVREVEHREYHLEVRVAAPAAN